MHDGFNIKYSRSSARIAPLKVQVQGFQNPHYKITKQFDSPRQHNIYNHTSKVTLSTTPNVQKTYQCFHDRMVKPKTSPNSGVFFISEGETSSLGGSQQLPLAVCCCSLLLWTPSIPRWPQQGKKYLFQYLSISLFISIFLSRVLTQEGRKSIRISQESL